jgi:hypothetical protein
MVFPMIFPMVFPVGFPMVFLKFLWLFSIPRKNGVAPGRGVPAAGWSIPTSPPTWRSALGAWMWDALMAHSGAVVKNAMG